jgi:hypothetical protein
MLCVDSYTKEVNKLKKLKEPIYWQRGGDFKDRYKDIDTKHVFGFILKDFLVFYMI